MCKTQKIHKKDFQHDPAGIKTSGGKDVQLIYINSTTIAIYSTYVDLARFSRGYSTDESKARLRAKVAADTCPASGRHPRAVHVVLGPNAFMTVPTYQIVQPVVAWLLGLHN